MHVAPGNSVLRAKYLTRPSIHPYDSSQKLMKGLRWILALGVYTGSCQVDLILEDDCILWCWSREAWLKFTDVTEVRAAFITHRPDDECSTNLWNVGKLLPECTNQHPRRQSSSYSPPWELEISPNYGKIVKSLFGKCYASLELTWIFPSH
jgi:hypothetical protein